MRIGGIGAEFSVKKHKNGPKQQYRYFLPKLGTPFQKSVEMLQMWNKKGRNQESRWKRSRPDSSMSP